jgi:large subunit ribosomal protein L18
MRKKVYSSRRIKSQKDRLRLCVFRSLNNIYAQIIDDEQRKTIVSASSLKLDKAKKTDMAKQVGELVAKSAIKNNIKKVVLDRGQYKYHGRIKALAEAARENGLQF